MFKAFRITNNFDWSVYFTILEFEIHLGTNPRWGYPRSYCKSIVEVD